MTSNTDKTKKVKRISGTDSRVFDLASLNWTVAGYIPTSWTGRSMELGFALEPEIAPVPARVPGSVQQALRSAGILPDWFEGLNTRACEWVENRDWMYSAKLPDAWFTTGRRFVLNCGGLDGPGIIVFNKKQVGSFDNAFIPHPFDLTEHVQPSGNELHLIFFLPPRWLGQVGYTSRMKDWKVRFNYGWDWVPRMVQIGPWEPVTLTVSEGAEIEMLRCRTDWDVVRKTGTLWIKGTLKESDGHRLRVTLLDGDAIVKSSDLTPETFTTGMEWDGLSVAPWQPNGSGDRHLYTVACELLDAEGGCVERQNRRVGFKHIDWQPCANAPKEADPWICVINGKPTFLQGIDWTPILPTFADVTREQYRRLVELYANLGCNIFRVWGGAFLEKTWFYDLCDEHGILVWQEFPLCSSGHENWPHEDEPSMDTLVRIAESYIMQRQHHASLLMWCGGNELQGDKNGGKTGTGKPVGLDHPLMHRWAKLVEREDPGRRFVPTSSSGPRFMAFPSEFGKGLHWDVHGPWKAPGETPEECAAYWDRDDALFRSETGAPGASSAEIIRRYSGGFAVMPCTMENRLWRRFPWWLEWSDFLKEKRSGGAGSENNAGSAATGDISLPPAESFSLEDYVEWSQARQARLIGLAIRSSKKRFPAIGGIILWMGHDAFPCNSNTSIIDFHGNPKPAALAASEIWKTPVEILRKAGK